MRPFARLSWYWKEYIIPHRSNWLCFITSTGLLAGLFMSAFAWSTARSYPLVPLIPNFSLPDAFHTNLFLVLIVSVAGSLFFHTYRRFLIPIGLLALGVLLLLDITRVQPWVLHYGAILLLCSAFIPTSTNRNTFILDTARIIVGGIYFWSGLQKLNLRFFAEIFPWLTEPLWLPFHEIGALVAFMAGVSAPFIETAFAIGLFTKRFRTISIIGNTGMVLLILLSISPFGHDWNSAVWPWNVGIYATVLVLFLGWRVSFSQFVRRQRYNYLGWIAFSVFWLLPAGNLFGFTDHYLSWSLYSGRVPEATLIGDQTTLLLLSPKASAGELPFARWTETDLNLVPYPEERVFKAVFSELCTMDPTLELQIMTPRLFHNLDNQKVVYRCLPSRAEAPA